MAVPEQTPYIEHTGNGSSKSFSLGFQCESKDHLIVLIDDIEPPIATWSLNGGNVVFTTAPAAGKKITAQRNTPFSRNVDYQSYNNSFRPPAVNKDFDWIWWKLQELGVADWILGARIDALKNYVDDRDDELKAYLMEEIRKQGVALDQLDEYYNYLMERLAQIAVDKGWDASFVVDGNENQHDINNKTPRFFKNLSELLSYKPKNNGQLVTLFAYHDGGQQGGSDLIAIQSNILNENGVTVFRSKVVGYEDYFWVRVNISHITPEMAGAIGDKTYNCREAFRACFSVGGKIKPRDTAKYLVSSSGLTPTAGESIILIEATKNFELVSDGWAEMYFENAHAPHSVVSMNINNENLTINSAKIRNVGWFGHTEVGHSSIAARAACPHFVGVHNPDLKNVRSSTFRTHTIHFTRRKTDWIQSSDLNQANTEAAVNRLMENACKNVKLRNIRLDNCASTGISLFSVDGLDASGIRADMTGALYDLAIWTDDASSQTKLADYSLNRNIHIRDVVGGSIDLSGCVSGSVSHCEVREISVRSYDFDQQKDNFDSGTHLHNTEDHLTAPFMWQQWFDRGIVIHDNKVNKMKIRSIYVDIHDNFLKTTAAGQSLIVFDRNGIRWGNGTDHFDQEIAAGTGIKNNIKNNTYLVRHDNCIGIDYGTASANSFVNAIDNIVEKHSPTLNFTPIRYSTQSFRRDSYFETSGNGGNFLIKRYNHLVDVAPNLLMQGLGTCNLKTFFSVAANKSAQCVAKFTAAQKVFFLVNILDSEGRYYRKKVEVTDTDTLTVTDLDSQTIYNASFALVVNSGVKQLNFGSSVYSVNIDVQGIGVRGDCVFSEPENRLRIDV